MPLSKANQAKNNNSLYWQAVDDIWALSHATYYQFISISPHSLYVLRLVGVYHVTCILCCDWVCVCYQNTRINLTIKLRCSAYVTEFRDGSIRGILYELTTEWRVIDQINSLEYFWEYFSAIFSISMTWSNPLTLGGVSVIGWTITFTPSKAWSSFNNRVSPCRRVLTRE